MKTKTNPINLDERIEYDPIGDLRAVIADSEDNNVAWVRSELSHMIKYGPSGARDILSVIRALVSMTHYQLQQAESEAA